MALKPTSLAHLLFLTSLLAFVILIIFLIIILVAILNILINVAKIARMLQFPFLLHQIVFYLSPRPRAPPLSL